MELADHPLLQFFEFFDFILMLKFGEDEFLLDVLVDTENLVHLTLFAVLLVEGGLLAGLITVGGFVLIICKIVVALRFYGLADTLTVLKRLLAILNVCQDDALCVLPDALYSVLLFH